MGRALIVSKNAHRLSVQAGMLQRYQRSVMLSEGSAIGESRSLVEANNAIE